MKIISIAVIAAISLSACATVTPVPVTRKLTPDVMSKLGETDVVIIENEDGVRAGWTSAGAAQPGYTDYSYLAPPGTSPVAAGIGAGIGQAIAIAILDAAPSARAKRSVATINMGIDKAKLDDALIQKIKNTSREKTLRIGEVSSIAYDRKAPEPMDKIKVVSSYTLAEDASAIRVKAIVTYENDALTYQTPYAFDGKTPKSELMGPLYRNSFTYHSDKFEIPELTDSLRAELIEAIEVQYKEDIAALEPGKAEEKTRKKLSKSKEKALEKANDDKLSKTEAAVLLISQWRGDGSPVLQNAIEQGQSFIADMLIADMNDSEVPQFAPKNPDTPKASFWTGQPVTTGPIGNNESTVIETKPNGRKVERIDSGINAGAYHSYPSNGFATYGNTYKVNR